jgi:hypothetical protein
MTNGLLIYGEKFVHFLLHCIRKPFLIYDFAPDPNPAFPYICGKLCFLFYQCIKIGLIECNAKCRYIKK